MAFTVSHPDVSVETTNQDGCVVIYAPATTAGGEGVAGAVSYGSHASGTEFPVGDTTVEMACTDSISGGATGSFTVTVVLVDVPTIEAPVTQWQLLRADTKPRGEQQA